MRIKKTVESLVAAVTSTDVSAIECDLAKLEQRRAQLAESLDVATHNAIDASAARRELIIANRDQQILEGANAKVRDAEERRVALDDALRALDEKIDETTTRLEKAKEKTERDRVGQVLEQEADAVEKESLALDRAAKEFASAFQQLRSTPSSASCLRTTDRHRLREDRVAGLLAAEALAGAAPDLFVHEPGELGSTSILSRAFPLGSDVVRFVTRDQQQLATPSGAAKQAEMLITTRLRTKAAAIRSGQELAVLPSAPPEQPHLVTRRPQRHVLFLQPVRYTSRFGRPVLHDAWAARVPALVAEAAIKRGVAMNADTDAAREKMTEMAELRRRTSARMPAVTVEDTIDLGVSLAEEVDTSEISGAA
jgi:hypothetical protein